MSAPLPQPHFLPTQQPIDIIVEFPDGRTRPLVSTTLFVDGQKVAENTAEPFNHFTWDLSGYATSGQHILSVEAVDSLGLSKISLGVPVTGHGGQAAVRIIALPVAQ